MLALKMALCKATIGDPRGFEAFGPRVSRARVLSLEFQEIGTPNIEPTIN